MIRFGLIGTNWITDRFLSGAEEVEQFALRAVYSRTEERALEFAEKHGIPHTYTCIEAMVKSGEIDAVYIASPNSLHSEQAILCMKHGIHVLCEKPIASNARELKAMIEAAKANGVLLMEALKSTFMPGFAAVRDNLEQVGTVRRYCSTFCQYSSRYDAYKQGSILNAFDPAFSNGALMDIGIYCIYPAVVLFGRPDEIKATGYMLESGVDGEGSILLKYKGMEAVVMYSKITDSSLPTEIQGESGTITIDKISEPKQIMLRHRSGSTENLSRPTSERTMSYELQEFIGLIERGELESRVNSFDTSLAVMEIIDEARRQLGLVYPADTAAE